MSTAPLELFRHPSVKFTSRVVQIAVALFCRLFKARVFPMVIGLNSRTEASSASSRASAVSWYLSTALVARSLSNVTFHGWAAQK